MHNRPTHLARSRKGFTLIELLITVLVIGTISGFVYAKFGPVKERTYVAAMKNTLAKFVQAQENYMDANNTYGTVSDLETTMGFTPDDNVTLEDANLTLYDADSSKYGFEVTVSHKNTSAVCGIQYGASGPSGTEFSGKTTCAPDGNWTP